MIQLSTVQRVIVLPYLMFHSALSLVRTERSAAVDLGYSTFMVLQSGSVSETSMLILGYVWEVHFYVVS